ncbi:MAG: hypothetical protein ACJZ8O_01135 [Pirellulaceae bacterium]
MTNNRIATFFCFLTLAFTGCGESSSDNATSGGGGHSHGHDHSHGHGHNHASEGPHGGHILEIGEEQFHLEWSHTDSGKLSFYLLDSEMKKDVTTDASAITISVAVSGKASETHEIPGVKLEDGSYSQFEKTDPVLATQLQNVGPAVIAIANVSVNGEEFEVIFEEQDHSGHNH